MGLFFFFMWFCFLFLLLCCNVCEKKKKNTAHAPLSGGFGMTSHDVDVLVCFSFSKVGLGASAKYRRLYKNKTLQSLGKTNVNGSPEAMRSFPTIESPTIFWSGFGQQTISSSGQLEAETRNQIQVSIWEKMCKSQDSSERDYLWMKLLQLENNTDDALFQSAFLVDESSSCLKTTAIFLLESKRDSFTIRRRKNLCVSSPRNFDSRNSLDGGVERHEKVNQRVSWCGHSFILLLAHISCEHGIRKRRRFKSSTHPRRQWESMNVLEGKGVGVFAPLLCGRNSKPDRGVGVFVSDVCRH